MSESLFTVNLSVPEIHLLLDALVALGMDTDSASQADEISALYLRLRPLVP